MRKQHKAKTVRFTLIYSKEFMLSNPQEEKLTNRERAWMPLEKGDKIALVFPAHCPPNFPAEAEIDRHKEWIEKYGLILSNEDSLHSLLDEKEWGEKMVQQKDVLNIFLML